MTSTREMTSTRQTYLSAAESAATLLRDPAVAAAWAKPSALPEFQVSGLAGHLARQIVNVPQVLAAPVPSAAPIPLLEHYVRSSWIDATVDSEVSTMVRRSGEETAVAGPQALATRVATTLGTLSGVLAAEPADRVVDLPWAQWALTLDDYLATRMLEIAVHSDDLAVSVGVETPLLPAPVFDPVISLLSTLAVRRYGQPAVLRALSRAERAPDTIAAI